MFFSFLMDDASGVQPDDIQPDELSDYRHRWLIMVIYLSTIDTDEK